MKENDENIKLESFVIYNSFYKPISKLTDEQLGKLFRALFRYNMNEEQDIDADIEMAFEFFKNQFERDRLKYQKRVEANRANGKKGGRPRKENETQINRENPLGYLGTEETQVNRENPNEAKKAYYYNDNDNYKERTLSKERVPKKDEPSLPNQGKDKEGHIDWQAFQEYFNTTFEGKLPTIQKMTETRMRAVKARVAQYGKDRIPEAYKKVLESDFLMGNNPRNWRPDFDWIFKAANFTKILEGNYSQKARGNGSAKPNNITNVNDEWESRR